MVDSRRAAQGTGHRRPRGPSPRVAAGFSLVETLVASLLVALAMIGLGGLQLATLRGAGTSLDLLAAAGHASSHQERVRALHDAPDEARAALGGMGAAIGCNADRVCTPVEFAQDEASHWRPSARLRWVVRPPVLDESRLRLEVARDGGPFVAIEVTT